MFKNEIRSGETGISAEPGINNTKRTPFRQEGKLPRTITYDTLPFNNWGDVRDYIKGYRQARSKPDFREYAPSSLRRQVDSAIKLAKKSPVLRAAAAVVLALAGVSAFADSHQTEASSILPLDTDPGYTPLFPRGDMVRYDHDSHDFEPASNLNTPNVDLVKLNPEQFVIYSGGGFTATRIHGDGAPTDLSYIIVGQHGYNDQQLIDSAQIYASNLLSLEPFKSVADKLSISVLHTQGTPDLGVVWKSDVRDVLGDDQKVNKLIDDLHQRFSPFQELRMLVNHTTGFAAAEYADPNQPTIYSYGAMTEARLRGPFSIRGGIAHMEGHATGGAGEGNYSANHYGNEPNVYYNCLTADQIPIRWKGIPGAPTGPSPEIEGCGNTKTGAFKETPISWMSHINDGNSYGPVTSWFLTHRIDGAPANYYASTLLLPASGVTLGGLGVDMRFKFPSGAEQFQIQVLPYGNDGPGLNMIRGSKEEVQKGSFPIAAPELGRGPYIMLPDMGYTWRVRSTSSRKPVSENDPVWGPWAESKFRTPVVSSAILKLPDPEINLLARRKTPFIWESKDPRIFYWDVMVSGDNRFDENPATATSFVWRNLVHGGVTIPPNSYTAPTKLDSNTTYYWRVKPRVQGDGKEPDWGPTWAAQTGSDGIVFRVFEVQPPAGSSQQSR